MGRASRRKKLRREAHSASGDPYSHRLHRNGDRAEQFGRSVGSAVSDYVEVASRGQDSLAAALISRHNQRMERVGRVQTELIGRARVIVNQLYFLDRGLRMLALDVERPPVYLGHTWPDHLAWGVDSQIAAIRLLFAGQLVGAAQIARSQLERWALNLEYSVGMTHMSGESVQEYYNRLWAATDAKTGMFVVPEADRSSSGQRRLPITGRLVHPGQLYDEMSEFLHGRGRLCDAVQLEACDLLDAPDRGPSLHAGNAILDVLELCVERIRACLPELLASVPCTNEQAVSILAGSQASLPSGRKPYPGWTLWPLVPQTGLSAQVVAELRASRDAMNRVRAGERPAGRLYYDDEMSQLFFMSRRGSSVEFALWNFRKEAELLAEPLNLESLTSRQFSLLVVAEALALVSRWDEREAMSVAAAMISSGLRSAFWLWLEDDDRAMGVLRAVLESTARLRTWNLKPAKAEKLEGRGSLAKPFHWLEAAGWKRLNGLNAALGELAHTRSGSRWTGARDFLIALQPDDEDPDLAPHRGRGFALDCLIALAAKTALDSVESHSPALRQHLFSLMNNTGVFNERIDRELEHWLDRTWSRRSVDLGAPDLNTGPAVDGPDRR